MAHVKIPNPYVWPLTAEVQGSTGGGGGSGFGTLTALQVGNFVAAPGEFVQCDPTAGAFNVDFPLAAAAGANAAITVSNVTGSVNDVTVVLAGADTSFGQTTIPIAAYTTVTFISDGVSQWIRA